MKKLQKFFFVLLAVMALTSVTSCEEEDPIEDQNTENPGGSSNGGSNSQNLPTNSIVLSDATDILFNGCQISATTNVEKGANYQVVIRFWEDIDGKLPDFDNPGDPTIFGSYLDPTHGTGKNQTFSAKLSYLHEKTTYRYIGFICFEDGKTIKSDTKTFTTAELVLDSSKAVDMGLSVKWASYNLGASKPEEPGDFYAWGETQTKDSFTEYNYLLHGKYNSTDGLTTLLPADDAATANWGEGFRMPTCGEKHELLLSTDRYYLDYHGVSGVLFVSQVNGNMIFFPFAGGKVGSNIQRANDLIGIWTSTAHENDESAYIMCNIIANSGILEKAGFDMDGIAGSFNLSSTRSYGYMIRPVSK